MQLFRFLPMIYRNAEDGGGAAPSPDAGAASPSGDVGGTPSSPDVGSATPSEPASPASPSADDFSFPSDMDDDTFLAEEPALEPEVPVAPVEPAQPVAPAAPAPAAAAPASPQVPQGPTEPQQPTLSLADPMSIARVMRENEPNLIEHLAQTEFALSPEDIAGLEEDAVAYTPKLLAKTYVRMQQNMMAQFARVIPAMITAHSEITQKSAKSEEGFFSRWPGLNKDEYRSQVRHAAQVYRRMNPQATKEEMVEELGQILSIRLKVPLTAAPSPRPAAPNNGMQRPVQTTPPFRPAMGGPAAPPSPQAADPWAGLGQETEG